MPPVVPTSRSESIQFFEERVATWLSNATSIGLTNGQVTAFIAQVSDARDMLDNANQTRIAAKVATQGFYDSTDTMRANGAALVAVIKAFAENTDNPNVYNLALIPPPADPSVMPPPGQPTDLTASLDAGTGAITLKWKCVNPEGAAGTSYIVRRKNAGQSTFTFVGVTGSRKFTDATFIAGPDSVQYTVQGQRSDSTGPVSGTLMVNFGQAPTGFAISSMSSGEGEMKMAA